MALVTVFTAERGAPSMPPIDRGPLEVLPLPRDCGQAPGDLCQLKGRWLSISLQGGAGLPEALGQKHGRARHTLPSPSHCASGHQRFPPFSDCSSPPPCSLDIFMLFHGGPVDFVVSVIIVKL